MAHQTFTDSTFKTQVLESKIPVVVDFWAEWCPPCKIISPLIDDLAKEYDGKVVIGKIDSDENPQTPERYNVMSLPTVMLFKDGKPVQVLIGAQGKHTYKTEIEKLLSS
jgi:thioredoxin 1